MQAERKTWLEIESEVRRTNGELANAITASLPGREPPIFWALSYDYRADIVADSQFVLPYGVREPQGFARAYKPTGVPIALVLDNSVEIYTRGASAFTAPLRILYPGELFGAFEAADSLHENQAVSTYSISSGFRSIWIACKLGDKGIGRARWNAKQGRCHSELVRDLIQSGDIPSWQCRVVCLPYDLLKSESRLSELGLYVMRTAWLQSTVHRQQFALDRKIAELCAKDPDWLAYAEVVKHLTSVARGLAPAHRAWARPSDVGGPFSAVQEKIKELLARTHRTVIRTQRVSPPYPYVLQPVQLQKRGDFGFYSFCDKVPGLPLGVRLPKYGPEQARQVCALLISKVQSASLPQEVSLDSSLGVRSSLKFYCRGRLGDGRTGRGGQPFTTHQDLTPKEFLGERSASIYGKDPYLLSCVRIRRDA